MINFSKHATKKRASQLIFIISCFLFSYTAIRAYVLAITWDEAFCYLEFTRYRILFPVYFNGMSANNHLLNTWLTSITTLFFDNHEFSLRIPNLFAHLLFLFFTAKIVNEFSSKLLSISAFLILNLNPYLLDFFSLSRGYGLSYGLLAGSLWYLYLFLKNNFQYKFSILSLLFSMVATFAHLTLLYFVLSIFGIVLMLKYLFIEETVSKNLFGKILTITKKNFILMLMMFFFLLIIIPLGANLAKAGALFYGGQTSFWSDTVLSVLDRSLYEKSYSKILTPVASYFCVLIFFISALFSVRIIKNKKQSPEKYYFVLLFILLCSCSFASVLQHYLLNTLFLTERTALFLLILFSYILVFLLNKLSEIKNSIIYIAPLIAGFMLLHFISCFNFYYVLEWKYDADMKTMLSDIESLKKADESKFNFSLGTTLELEQPVNYYRFINNLTWLNEASRTKDFTGSYDACIVLDMDFKKLNTDSFRVLKNYPFVNNKLIQYKLSSSKDSAR